MSILHRVVGLSLRDRMRSSAIREELGIEPLLLSAKRSQIRWFGHVVRMPPKCLRKTQDTLQGLCFSAGPGTPRESPGQLDKVAGEREVWTSLLRLLPTRLDPE